MEKGPHRSTRCIHAARWLRSAPPVSFPDTAKGDTHAGIFLGKYLEIRLYKPDELPPGVPPVRGDPFGHAAAAPTDSAALD